MNRGFNRPVGNGLFKHLIVPKGLVVGMQENVGVNIHQAWQHGHIRQFQGKSACRCLDFRSWPHSADFSSAHQDHPIFVAAAIRRAKHALGD